MESFYYQFLAEETLQLIDWKKSHVNHKHFLLLNRKRFFAFLLEEGKIKRTFQICKTILTNADI